MTNQFRIPSNFKEPIKTKIIDFEKPLSGEELHNSKVLEETLPHEKVKEIHEVLSQGLEALNTFRANLGLSQIPLPRIIWGEIQSIVAAFNSAQGSILKLNPERFLNIPKNEAIYLITHELVHLSDINRIFVNQNTRRSMSGVAFSTLQFYDPNNKQYELLEKKLF